MSSLEQISENINLNIDSIKDNLDRLSNRETLNKAMALNKIKIELSKLNNLINAFDQQLSELTEEAQVEEQRDQLNLFKSKQAKLQKKYEEQTSTKNYSFGLANSDDKTSQELQAMTQKQAIKYGDKLQEDGNQILDYISRKIQETDQLADEVNLKLDQQIEKLDSIQGNIKDTESILKRSMKLIKYF